MRGSHAMLVGGRPQHVSSGPAMSETSRNGWLHRLRERGVIRVAASYAVIAWLLLQIADVTFEPLGVPRWVMVSLIVAAVLGFPIAVALAWFYEAGDRGVARDTAAEGVPRPVVHGLRRYADIAIIAVLLAAVAVLLVRQSDIGGSAQGLAIAVLPFENLSNAEDGEVLASGIAESVLHQLASLANLEVISRTSSFAFREKAADAREIGRQLGARYLLEGSVQRSRERMRVTTQLIDTETGADVWSMRFDRPTGDIFEVQDEIALQVTRALELSIDAKDRDRLTGQGTENLDAYLAFLQGRSLQANDRLVDTRDAIRYYEKAIEADPKFAAPYVSLAAAKLFVADLEVTDDRTERFKRALDEGRDLIGRALALDPEHGDAYLQRANLAYNGGDVAAAEADYRRGLELSPNAAEGYAGLAAVLYQSPLRRDEALEMLERARRIDPLQPRYDVFKAVFLIYERGDPKAADRLLSEVLEEHPRYLPALIRICEIRGLLLARQAEAIRACEQAIAIDPLLEEARRLLVLMYLDVGESAAAEDLADSARGGAAVLRVFLTVYRKDWEPAGEAAYEALAQGTDASNNRSMMFYALRMHARKTGQVDRAIAAVEPLANVDWDDDGRPVLRNRSELRDAEVTLADLLLLDGQQERSKRLLTEIIRRMKTDLAAGRPELWYLTWHPVALALAGDSDGALALLERSVNLGPGAKALWWFADSEPAFHVLHSDQRFQKLVARVKGHAAEQLRQLQRMRAEGSVPARL